MAEQIYSEPRRLAHASEQNQSGFTSSNEGLELELRTFVRHRRTMYLPISNHLVYAV